MLLIDKNKNRRMMKNVGGLNGLIWGMVGYQARNPGDGDNACNLHADAQTETLGHRWDGSTSAAWEACFSPHNFHIIFLSCYLD